MTREEQYLRALWALVDAIDGFKRGGATGVAVETYDNALADARSILSNPVAAHAGTDEGGTGGRTKS